MIYTYGLVSIEMGDIAGDGGMGTSLTDLGAVYQDTAKLVTGDATETEHYSEQSEDPILVRSKKGKTTMAFTLVDYTSEKLALVMGGTATAGTSWAAPATLPNLEKSFKITTENGSVINIPRGKVAGKITWDMGKTQMGKIDVVVTILKPTKAATAAMEILEP